MMKMPLVFPDFERMYEHFNILDVRSVPEIERPLRVLQAFEGLRRGGAFILITNADPHMMCEHVRSEIRERCDLQVLEREESIWRVLVRNLS